MKVSLILTTYNRKKQLRQGLATILNQKVAPHELIIVDDGSTDGTEEYLGLVQDPMFLPKWKYIYLNHPAPRISTIPHNVGILAAEGDILIFSEPEALHVGDTIFEIAKHLEEKPNEVPLATQIWTMGQKMQQHMTGAMVLHPETILTHGYAQLTDAEHPQNINAPDSDWAITGSKDCYAGVLFGCYKKDAVAIGGFDESFEKYGWDDWDFLKRLELYGKKTAFRNDLIVIHQWHEKNYDKDIYECSERNGKKSEARIRAGEYRANIGKDWGRND